jgi:hypothetical protein
MPKKGHTLEEYEDAFAGRGGRFAIADGATESSFAALWARLLVRGFVASRGLQITPSWLGPLCRRWAAAVDDLQLEWYGEEKRQAGAFATFLGLSFKKPRPGREGKWKAVAVGDSCLFQVRDDQLIAAFPVQKSADFGNRPALLGSRVFRNDSPTVLARGTWRSGDRFYLMTDALAEWFLRRHENSGKPWQVLARGFAGSRALLSRYIELLRREKDIQNDDVTLLMIELG